jgi:hypothetical protein
MFSRNNRTVNLYVGILRRAFLGVANKQRSIPAAALRPSCGARMTRFATQNPSNGRQRARGTPARSYFSIWRSFK